MKLEQIDTSTTAGKVEVMRLAAEGRRVVARNVPGWKVSRNEWMELPGPDVSWDWRCNQYAIIAEPVGPDEVWVSIHSNGVFAAVHMVRPMVHQGDSIVRYVRASE